VLYVGQWRTDIIISFGELTLDVGESTSHIGKLTRWQNQCSKYHSAQKILWEAKIHQQKSGCKKLIW